MRHVAGTEGGAMGECRKRFATENVRSKREKREIRFFEMAFEP